LADSFAGADKFAGRSCFNQNPDNRAMPVHDYIIHPAKQHEIMLGYTN